MSPDGIPIDPADAELLAAFDRLSPQGSLRWGFDDAMGRIAAQGRTAGAAAVPWEGLPDDLWERGRTARVGQRFVGDVAGVMAQLLAADARHAADTAIGDRLVAVWDALRYLAARVEVLEGRVDPAADLATEPGVSPPLPDVGAWVDQVGTWFAPLGGGPVVVGESGQGALLDALADAGHRACGVEPRGPLAWRSSERPGGSGATSGHPGHPVVFGEVAGTLAAAPDASVAGVVLVGCVDRLDLPGKLALVTEAVRVIAPGGTIAVLATDQSAWDDALAPPARDLAPGRPLHPETWSVLLRQAGVVEPVWHRPATGPVHAVVGAVGGAGAAGGVGGAGAAGGAGGAGAGAAGEAGGAGAGAAGEAGGAGAGAAGGAAR